MKVQTQIFTVAIPFAIPASRWEESYAAPLRDAELLLSRSNLLGSDLTVTDFGGGNTLAKLGGLISTTANMATTTLIPGRSIRTTCS